MYLSRKKIEIENRSNTASNTNTNNFDSSMVWGLGFAADTKGLNLPPLRASKRAQDWLRNAHRKKAAQLRQEQAREQGQQRRSKVRKGQRPRSPAAFTAWRKWPWRSIGEKTINSNLQIGQWRNRWENVFAVFVWEIMSWMMKLRRCSSRSPRRR